MIRIELDRTHLELLLLSGLFAALAGVVFRPILYYGINVVPLGTFGGVAVIGAVVLLLRRVTSWEQARLRSILWFGLIGGFAGATISRVAVGSTEKMLYATAGAGAMSIALAAGMKVTVVIKSQQTAAREAVDEILEEKNVYTAQQQFEANTSRSNDDSRTESNDSEWGSATDGTTEDRSVDTTEDPGSESWHDEDDTEPIPVIRSISSVDSADE